ncbi:MAG: hypothetical protein HYY21_10555 [Candidatus Tectomicrobia bacterium]|nr:hypothetical protein [Candidatus Tectomicrobia bacterium]
MSRQKGTPGGSDKEPHNTEHAGSKKGGSKTTRTSYRDRLSGIEREQMEIHQSRFYSSNELDRFLLLMLGLIATVAFVSLYLTGNL